MTENEVRQVLEEVDPEGKIPQAKVEEIVAAMAELEKNPIKDGEVRNGYHFAVLQEQLSAEPDWRKRASLAARIISQNLE